MKGIYMLLIENAKDVEVETGEKRTFKLKKGFYAYLGSALSGLEGRIRRHLRKEQKKLHWHIDYLLARPGVKVKEVIFAETEKRKECEIAENMMQHNDFTKNFGCTDCSCKSHLFFSTSLGELKEHVFNSFHESGLKKVKELEENKC